MLSKLRRGEGLDLHASDRTLLRNWSCINPSTQQISFPQHEVYLSRIPPQAFVPKSNSHAFPPNPGPIMTCYTFNAFVGVTNSTWGIPCGPGPSIQTCCNSGDFCLSNNTCYTPTTKYGQGVMNLSDPYPYNWYVAGCTDPTYTAPQCSSLCCMLPPSLCCPSLDCEIVLMNVLPS
jgi:hypothetical protein